MKMMTEHITKLLSEKELQNIEINIKLTNLVKVHLNELDELRQNKIKLGGTFMCLETGFMLPSHLKTMK